MRPGPAQQKERLHGWKIIGTIIFGAVVGALARLVLPGRQNISILVTVVLGILGALIGYFIYHSLGGGDTNGIDWIARIISIIVAAVLVVIYGTSPARSRSADRLRPHRSDEGPVPTRDGAFVRSERSPPRRTACCAAQADRPSRSIRRVCSSVSRANIRPSSARSAPGRL